MKKTAIALVLGFALAILGTACVREPISGVNRATVKKTNNTQVKSSNPTAGQSATVGESDLDEHMLTQPNGPGNEHNALAETVVEHFSDAGVETEDKSVAVVSPSKIFSAEEHQAWCIKARKPRTWGPPGVYKNHLPWIKATVCKDRFTYRVKAYVEDEQSEESYYKVAVVYLTDSGDTKEVYTFTLSTVIGWGSQNLEKFKVGDVDGDGQAEVFIAIYTHEEGYFEWQTRLLTLKDGKLEPVVLPENFSAENIKDADQDGLYDVVTNGPYGNVFNDTVIGGEYPVFWGRGVFLLHSLGGFNFSMDDSVAQRKIRKHCPAKVLSRKIKPVNAFGELIGPEPKKRRGPDWRNPLQVICARVYGSDVKTVQSSIWQQCGSFGDPPLDEGCYRSLLNIAAKEPPSTLLEK